MSSRESSPRRPSKRSFSPASDEGDFVVPPTALDDTPPPSRRPLLRQPVAFAWSSTSSVAQECSALNTYEAVVPNVDAVSGASFLPGQSVSLPAPVMNKKGGRSGSRRAEFPSKKRRNAVYAEHTSRFRLQPCDRLSNQQAATAEAQVENSATRISQVSDLTSRVNGDTEKISQEFCHSPSISTTARRTAHNKAKDPTKSRRRLAKSPEQPHTDALPTSPQVSIPSSSQSKSPPVVQPHQFGSDSRERHVLPLALHPHVSRSVTSRGKSSSSQRDVVETSARRLIKQCHTIVTVLIQDIRSGVIDHQLAEVRVPLEPLDDPAEGFRADARLLSEQLQSGPSRIDGPAKVYTLRGIYRHFFLRVTADNVDHSVSTNLIIRPQRTIEIVVEELLPPGQLPLPPRIPLDLNSDFALREETSRNDFVRQKQDTDRDFPSPQRSHRRNSSPSETSAIGSTSEKRLPKEDIQSKDRSICGWTGKTSLLLSLPGYRHESPFSDDEPDEIRRIAVNCVDLLLQQDPGWSEFFQAKAAQHPQTVSDILPQFRFVKKMTEKWVGQKLPFRTSEHLIETSHITEALKIDDPDFTSMCMETLNLLESYGPDGTRTRDTRITTLIEDSSRTDYNSIPIKSMLRLMREIDEQWKREHPDNQNSKP